MDLSVSISPPQPKTSRGGLSITSHVSAQTSRPVFLIYFLLRLPAPAQDSKGDPVYSLESSVVRLGVPYYVHKVNDRNKICLGGGGVVQKDSTFTDNAQSHSLLLIRPLFFSYPITSLELNLCCLFIPGDLCKL